jgi:hypothetical protein
MEEKLRTKVTFIKDKFHIRLLENDLLINEMACKKKVDIGWCCAYMLRWYDKLGGSSIMASKSRDRHHKINEKPEGKVWYEKDLRSIKYMQVGSPR